MDQVLQPLLGLPPDGVDEQQGDRQREQTDDDDEHEQVAHARLEGGFVLRQLALLNLDEGVHLGADGLHQYLALAASHRRQHGGRVMVAVQPDDIGHLRQFGIDQGSHGVQVVPGISQGSLFSQSSQLSLKAIAQGQVGGEEGFVPGQQETPLAGFRIAQPRQQGFRADDLFGNMLPGSGGFLHLRERPERRHHQQRRQEQRAHKGGRGSIGTSQGHATLPLMSQAGAPAIRTPVGRTWRPPMERLRLVCLRPIWM